MKDLKRRLLRIFFAVELCFFAGVYVYGPHGTSVCYAMRQHNATIQQDIDALKAEVGQLEGDIAAYSAHPFYKEKIAREQLQMARKGETIYYLE
jgi:cell division protein FtsB